MSAGRPHICFVIPSLDVGGTERQLQYLARGLSKTHAISVLCTRREGALAADMKTFAEVESLGLTGGWDARLQRRLYEAFRAGRPDAVHSFMFGFDHAVNVAARKAGVPVVISSRRQLATWKKPRHIRLQNRANALVDQIVANCDAVARFAAEQEGIPRQRFRVIPNGIHADIYVPRADTDKVREQLSIPPGRKVIGIVANFSPVKDHELFVEIAAHLNRQREDTHFLLVGDGPLREDTERRFQAAGLADRFTIVSRPEGAMELYGLMAVVVLCSKAEGSPNAVMEAMAARRPVVAARVGGVPELITDGVTGRLIASRSPVDFAECIAGLLDRPVSALRLGQAASDFVREGLTVDAMVETHASMYAELLARATSASGAA